MADKVTPEIRRNTMKAVKSKDSKMEVKFRSALWHSGLRFNKNVSSMLGKPDIVFPRKKIVVFLDSCFWHGCPEHLRLPSSNSQYWEAKINRNKTRDLEVNLAYMELGWEVLRIWEHQLKENFDTEVFNVKRKVQNWK